MIGICQTIKEIGQCLAYFFEKLKILQRPDFSGHPTLDLNSIHKLYAFHFHFVHKKMALQIDDLHKVHIIPYYTYNSRPYLPYST